MKKTDEKTNAYVAAVDTQEIKIIGEVNENRRVRDEYLAEIRVLVDSPNTASPLTCPMNCCVQSRSK